jgi:hypothetical protein
VIDKIITSLVKVILLRQYSDLRINIYCDNKLSSKHHYRSSSFLPDSIRRRISTTSWNLDRPTWDDQRRLSPIQTARSTTRIRNKT